MLKSAIRKTENKGAIILKKCLSVLLAAVLLIGTFTVIPFMANANDAATKNYPLLRELGDTGPACDNWDYSIRNKVYSTGEVDESYEAPAETEYICDTYSDSKEYYNQNLPANKYVFAANKTTVTLSCDTLGAKGMNLTFTAPESGYYDLSQKLAVEGNSSGVGTLYYRVVRLSDNKVVYPTDADWVETDINNDNPTVILSAATTYLENGDKIRIEAYTKLTWGSELTIDIGNPTVTFVDFTKTGEGEYISYEAFDYYLSQRDMTAPYYINDRFEFKMLNYTSSIENPIHIEFTNYNKSWAQNLYYNKGVPIIGIYGMGGNYGNRLKFKAAQQHAPQVTYNVAESGNLSMVVPIQGDIDVRIVKNDQQIWPESGFYPVKSACTIKANTEVEAGDKIHIQFYSDSPTVVSFYADPTFYQSTISAGNSSYSTIYSPLWERPYSYETEYSGEYVAPPISLFAYGYTDGSTVTAMNTFDSSKENYLYHADYPDSGFNFCKDDLTYTVSSQSTGMALTFTAPENGKYDFSSALKVVSGKGSAEFKILKGSETVFKSVFTAVEGYTLDLPAQLLELSMGETVQFIFTATPETSDPVVINLGTPVVYRFLNSTVIGSETIDIYTPDCFTAFEKQAVSTRLYAQNRFEYLLRAPDNNETALNIYNTAEKSITANGTGFKLSETGALTVDVKDTALTHIVKYTAPKAINGKIQFTLSSAAAAEVILTKNGEQIGTYTATATETPISIDAKLNKGDEIEWQIKSSTVSEVNLGILSITDVYHVTEYNETTVSYAALVGNPFGDEDYTGNYKRYDNEVWLYDIAEVNNGEAECVVPDKYTSQDTKYLYSSKSETGYYFENVLNATLKNSSDGKYGISLGFVAPRTDAFIFRTGLRILTENTTATIYARITKNGDTIWCGESESGWLSDTAISGRDIDIPFHSIDLSEGDVLRLEVYAENIKTNTATADTVKISLASPEVFSEKGKYFNNADIKGVLTYPYDEFRYKGVAYTGEFIPMENRWNYEFATFGDTVTVFSPDYYNATSIDLYSANTENSPHYKLSSKTFILTPESENAKGISLRYTSAVDAETIFQFVPSITAGADTANVMFRILSNGEVIWPKETETEEKWEVLTSSAPKSAIKDRLSLELKVGDDIEVQFYAQPLGENAGNVTVSMDAFAAIVDYKSAYNKAYIAANSNTTLVQLNPFWDYEYALDPENRIWQRASDYAAPYHNISSLSYSGVNPGLPLISITNGTALKNLTAPYGALPIVSMTLTAPKDGYYRIDANYATYYENASPAKIRITANDEIVWPTDGEWRSIGDYGNAINDYKGISVELKAGDKLRFETTVDMGYEDFITNGYRILIRWPVQILYSEYESVYTETDDIYNMLTPDMYEIYKALGQKGKVQFDTEYDKKLADSYKPGVGVEGVIIEECTWSPTKGVATNAVNPMEQNTQFKWYVYSDSSAEGELIECTEFVPSVVNSSSMENAFNRKENDSAYTHNAIDPADNGSDMYDRVYGKSYYITDSTEKGQHKLMFVLRQNDDMYLEFTAPSDGLYALNGYISEMKYSGSGVSGEATQYYLFKLDENGFKHNLSDAKYVPTRYITDQNGTKIDNKSSLPDIKVELKAGEKLILRTDTNIEYIGKLFLENYFVTKLDYEESSDYYSVTTDYTYRNYNYMKVYGNGMGSNVSKLYEKLWDMNAVRYQSDAKETVNAVSEFTGYSYGLLWSKSAAFCANTTMQYAPMIIYDDYIDRILARVTNRYATDAAGVSTLYNYGYQFVFTVPEDGSAVLHGPTMTDNYDLQIRYGVQKTDETDIVYSQWVAAYDIANDVRSFSIGEVKQGDKIILEMRNAKWGVGQARTTCLDNIGVSLKTDNSPADINGDFTGDASDTVYLRKFLIGSFQAVDEKIFDVNKDEKSNLRDLVRIKKVLASVTE